MTVITEANKTKARELTAQLTLDEKIAIVHAAGLFRNGNAERLGIPPLSGWMMVRWACAPNCITTIGRRCTTPVTM
ncbi:hypothetical protein RG269_02485 [Bifidobacterium adolescentis]|uniref:hypothetical protein n=1 Tax=Bifidobacterium adolescentis TaxID=1680 RepID=UPI0020CB07B4|nr:hypothetical protein [Bifidobacterium adolescentis]